VSRCWCDIKDRRPINKVALHACPPKQDRKYDMYLFMNLVGKIQGGGTIRKLFPVRRILVEEATTIDKRTLGL
jgi:hypothetical protein